MIGRQLRGANAYHAGVAAEQSVAGEYQRRGCKIAHERWRGAGGEIDLIARDGYRVIFIEVKKSRTFDGAALRLGGAKWIGFARQRLNFWRANLLGN